MNRTRGERHRPLSPTVLLFLRDSAWFGASSCVQTKEFPMKATIVVLGAAALSLAPSIASAQTPPGNGYVNGKGYWHQNSGNANGQPGASCEDLGAGST